MEDTDLDDLRNREFVSLGPLEGALVKDGTEYPFPEPVMERSRENTEFLNSHEVSDQVIFKILRIFKILECLI